MVTGIRNDPNVVGTTQAGAEGGEKSLWEFSIADLIKPLRERIAGTEGRAGVFFPDAYFGIKPL